MQRDEEGNVLVRAMVQVSIPVDLILTAQQYANPDFVRRAAAENFICHPAIMLNPDGPSEDTIHELVTGGWLDSVMIDGRNWTNPEFQPEELKDGH